MVSKKCVTTVSVLVATIASSVTGLDNGLGRLPQMGYNSWYDWTCNMEEKQLMATVDKMVELGLPALGYNYFNLDDCWASSRTANGTLIADPKFFPSSTLKPLADYVHSKGMKFGTYTDRGPQTCANRPAALGHEFQDAQTYADWGVDYLKEDSCHATGDHDQAFAEYGKMRDGLNKTGRPIFFSLCGWHDWYAPVGQTLGNSWRIGGDDTNWNGVKSNIDINAALSQYAGPGGWNDPCLLLAEDWKGDQRQTEMQTRAQFSMWAIMASPLLISANVRNMSAMNLATYTNKDVIAVSQDSLAKQGVRLVGGNLDGGDDSSKGGPKAHVAPCSGTPSANEMWEFGTPMAEYLKNKGNSQCVNVDNCGSDLIYYACVTGGTCSKNDTDMKFMIVDGTLRTAFNDQCATVQANNDLVLSACPTGAVPPAQSFAMDASTGVIKSGNGMCLATGSPSSTTKTNVWGRELHDGYAVAFINADEADKDVLCDQTCMTAMGFAPTDSLTVKDLWTGTITKATGTGITAKALAADGGIYMVKVTKM